MTADGSAPASPPRLVDGICELTLETDDPRRLERFYVEVFGCAVLDRKDDRVWLACGERTRLGIWSPGRKEFGDRGGRHVHFAFSVSGSQLDEMVRRLRALGIEHEGPVEHRGGDRSLYLSDPAGNVVELWDFFREGDGSTEGVEALRS